MSKRTQSKPDGILDAAAELFASRPFHEVRLEDVAASANVGKGTIYLYWSSKEDVYLAVIRRGFAAVLEQLDRELPSRRGGVWDKLDAVIGALVGFAFKHPDVYRIMRGGALTPDDAEIQAVRAALSDRVLAVLEEGIRAGELTDSCPRLTTQYILSFVRGAVLYPPPKMTQSMLVAHMTRVLRRGIAAGGAQ